MTNHRSTKPGIEAPISDGIALGSPSTSRSDQAVDSSNAGMKCDSTAMAVSGGVAQPVESLAPGLILEGSPERSVILFVAGLDLVGPYAFRAEEDDREGTRWQVYRHEGMFDENQRFDGHHRAVAVLADPVDRTTAEEVVWDLNAGIDSHYGPNRELPDSVQAMRTRFAEFDTYLRMRNQVWATFSMTQAVERLEALLAEGKVHNEHQLWRAYVGGDVTPGVAADGSTTAVEARQWAIFDGFTKALRERAKVVSNNGFNEYDWTRKG